VKFQKSNTEHKKYDAILENKETKRNKTLPFGDRRYQQYQDTTGLGIYTHKDHKDKERRLNYRKRHRGFIRKNFYSPGYFSLNYLW
jgi:hypothetical protein